MIFVNNNKFVLTTKNTEYAFCVDENGLLRNLYFGKKIGFPSDYIVETLFEVSTNDPVYEITKEEYPVYGGLRYKENCLKVCFDDNTRDIVYVFESYEINDNELIINLKDKHHNFLIKLSYKVLEDVDLIERKTILVNNTDKKIKIESIMSGQIHIPYENLNFSNTHG